MKELLRREGMTDVEVESAAMHMDELGHDIHCGTREKLREHGIPFSPRAAWLLTAELAHGYDLLIGMDSYNIADLRRLVYPDDRAKIRRLADYAGRSGDIADPWYTGNFGATYDDVLAGCEGLVRWLKERQDG